MDHPLGEGDQASKKIEKDCRKGSGSNLHQDPDLMGAWNLLLMGILMFSWLLDFCDLGRKWWAIHPAPLPLASINCDGQ